MVTIHLVVDELRSSDHSGVRGVPRAGMVLSPDKWRKAAFRFAIWFFNVFSDIATRAWWSCLTRCAMACQRAGTLSGGRRVRPQLRELSSTND